MKRRQEAAEEAERQRLQAEQEAKAAAEAEAEAARQAELAASRDSADAPGSPRSEQEAGKFYQNHHKNSNNPEEISLPNFKSLQIF
jgi:hypothetical protein